MILSTLENSTSCHPMNSNIDSAACLTALKQIKTSFGHLVSWKYGHTDGIQSAIGCLQIFSEKSQTSISAGATQFYPIHVTLQNLKEDARRINNVIGTTVVGFVPVTYCSLSSIGSSSKLLKQ